MRPSNNFFKVNEELISTGVKKCLSCGDIKSLTQYFKRKIFKDGYSPRCKVCYPERKEQLKKYNQVQKESKNEWRKKNLDKMNLSKTKWKLNQYNVSLSDYEKQREIQKDCCAICGIHARELPKRLSIDHCHKTMMFRGLLCDRCNRCIGQFEDNTELLQSAIEYLIKTKNNNWFN